MSQSIFCFIQQLLIFSLLTVKMLLLATGNAIANTDIFQDAEEKWAKWHRQFIDIHTIPDHQALVAQADTLTETLHQTCSRQPAVAQNQLVVIQEQFRALFQQWGKLQPIAFGPVTYLNRQAKMQYWPDKHGTGGRQLRRLLAEEAVVSADQIKEKSVALQGISALERVLFKQSSLSQKECLLALSIAQNIERIANNIYEGWTQAPAIFMDDFLPKNYEIGAFSSAQEATAVFSNSLLHYLQFIEEVKLSAIIHDKSKRPKPKRLEGWRRQIATVLLQENVSTLSAMYNMIFSAELKHKNKLLDQKIKDAFSQLESSINQEAKNLPLYQQLVEKNYLPNWLAIKNNIKTLRGLLQEGLYKELALPSSFNSLDGD